MRHLIVVLVAVVFATAAFVLKKHREKILIAGIVVLCLISGVYCYSRAEGILLARHPYNQAFSPAEYMETLEFPDAFLRLFLKDKTVYVKDDAMHGVEEANNGGFYWQYAYSHYYDMVHFLESINAEVVPDATMNDTVVSEDRIGDFEEVGYLNDLLRNSMMYSGKDSEIGNYLYYLWYYGTFTKPAKLYANADGLKDTDEIVIIWQPQGDGYEEKATEDMYLMSKEYYDTVYK